MTVLRKSESKFGAPVGVYVGVFLGLVPMRDDGKPRLGKDGRPMPPGTEWQWRITEGEQNGQIVSRITAAAPTPNNSCGQMMDGLVGRVVTCDEDVNTDAYIGQPYTIVIGANKDNPNKTQVQQIFRVPPPAAPVGGTPATTAAAPPPPPPPPSKATREFWVQKEDGKPPVIMDEHGLQHWLIDETKDPRTLRVCLAGTPDWKTAAECGFTDKMPF
jgi:hypothetical protein